MTRKDYELIAATIKPIYENSGLNDQLAVKAVAQDLATAFEGDNPRFNRVIFMAACGMGS